MQVQQHHQLLPAAPVGLEGLGPSAQAQLAGDEVAADLLGQRLLLQHAFVQRHGVRGVPGGFEPAAGQRQQAREACRQPVARGDHVGQVFDARQQRPAVQRQGPCGQRLQPADISAHVQLGQGTFQRGHVGPAACGVQAQAAGLQHEVMVAAKQLAQPVQRVVEGVACRVTGGVGPQRGGEPVDRHRPTAQRDQNFQQLQRLAAFLARCGRRLLAQQLEAAEQAHAQRPGPVFVRAGRRGQGVAADELQRERGLDVVGECQRGQARHHVAAAEGHGAEVEAEAAADRKGFAQRAQGTRRFAATQRKVGLDQPGQPVVPAAHGVEGVGQHAGQRRLGASQVIHLGGRQRAAEHGDVLAQRPAAGLAAANRSTHQRLGAGPVCFQQAQHAELEIVRGGVDGTVGVEAQRGFGQVVVRCRGVAAGHGGQAHHQMRLGALRRGRGLGQRERAAGVAQRIVDAAQQRADQHRHAVPAQQRAGRDVGPGAEAVDLEQDAVQPHRLPRPQQVVGQRAEQDALAGAERLVQQLLGRVGQRGGEFPSGQPVHEGGQQPGQHAQVGERIGVRQVVRCVLLQHRHPGLQRVQVAPHRDDGIGRRGGGAEGAVAVLPRSMAAAGLFQVNERPAGVDFEQAHAQPVGRPGLVAQGLGQRHDPVMQDGRAPLCIEAASLSHDERDRRIPGPGAQQQHDGRIGLAVFGQQPRGVLLHALQGARVQHLGSPRLQEFAEEGVERVDRRCAFAAFREETAPGQAGQQFTRARVAA